MRGRRLSRLNWRSGLMNAVVSCAPPARLVTSKGVIVPGCAWVVSIWLAHGNSTPGRSAFTGEALVLIARSQRG